MPVSLDTESDIVLENIQVFRGGKEIIKNISTTLHAGKTTVIMGSSGCGKSTLLKIAAGLILPDGGTVKISGNDINTLSDQEGTLLRKQWGFVFQDAALWANKSVLQNLTLPILYHDSQITEKDAASKAERIARRVGYKDEMSLRPSQLSSGEAKMISFARALISDPSCLFLDSPFLSVDYSSIEKMRKILGEFKRKGGTICGIFQDSKYIAQTADELMIVKEGRVIAYGPFADIINTRDPEISKEIEELLEQAASYDGSILDILSDSGNNPFFDGSNTG